MLNVLASHTLIYASVPVATASLLVGLAHRTHTANELEMDLDTRLQDRLCDLASSPAWPRATDEEAWSAIKELGGRRHLLSQARLLFALTIERSKDGDPSALVMGANLQCLAKLLRTSWKRLLMPSAQAHLCVEIYTDMCSVWETLESD